MLNKWKKKFPNSYIQTFKDNGFDGSIVCKPLDSMTEEEAIRLNESGAGVFATPNGFSQYTRRTEENCDLLNWWFVDIEGYQKEEQKKRIKSFKFQPTLVVETKNGFHCYWKISGKSPYWYKVIDRLIEYFGSDCAISSRNEVLRIPGFYHCKNHDDKYMIKLRRDTKEEYTEKDMLEELGEKQVHKKYDKQCESYEDDIEEIKAIPIRSVLDRLGVRHERNVIYENGQPTSAHIHPRENYIHRFSGKPGSGTVIDVVLTWGNKHSNSDAIEWLRREYGIARRKLKKKAETPIISEYFIDGGKLTHTVNRKMYESSKEDVIRYHIQLLNAKLGGIYKTSLVVIGADTGSGKSQFLSDLAYYACEQEKKVAYFDLENDEGDFILRQVSKIVSIERNENVSVNHLRTSEFVEKDDDICQAVERAFSDVYDNINGYINFYKNDKIPTIDDFLESVSIIRDSGNCDLIILDHLHYLEMDDKDNHSIQIGRIMRALKTLSRSNIPVIIASHLKQRQGANKKPTNYDLFGSSNIAKEAESVIMFSREDDKTLMQVTKNRSGGGVLDEWRGIYNKITRKIDFQIGF